MTDASRLRDPQAASDLLMYRLNKLMAVSGSLVIRLCEGGYGITRREWGLLMWLARHPDLPPAELARLLGLDRARTSRAITSLQDKKLITREPLPGDKRQARLRLTPEGLAVYEAVFPQVKQLNQALLRGLPTEAVEVLDQALTLLHVVDLPQPVGPTMATNSPRATCMLKLRSATVARPSAEMKRSDTSSNSIAGCARGASAPGDGARPAMAFAPLIWPPGRRWCRSSPD